MDITNLNWKETIYDPDASLRKAMQRTDWPALCRLATSLRGGVPCKPLDTTTNGLNNMARLLQFDDSVLWVARIAMRPPEVASAKLRSEVDTMRWIHESSGLPVPKVFASETEVGPRNVAGVPFVLMEFLPGNTAMDSNGGYDVNRGVIPEALRPQFYRQVAAFHVQMTSLRLPQIGTVRQREDGGFEAGPIPGIGGPFDTATEFFNAWADYTKFPRRPDEIVEIMRGAPETQQVLSSVETFLTRLRDMAPRLAQHHKSDNGPFPLCHSDFLHSNIVVDHDTFDVLGIIDWEGACTLPLELVQFPRFLSFMPRNFGSPNRFYEDGMPQDDEERQQWQERQQYLQMVNEYENNEGGGDHTLSKCLADESSQALPYAMDGFDGGKMGLYGQVLDDIEKVLSEGK
ncbi:hypothetical protein Sste5346_003773 [Sporothrix stenoceras]|uniref:Aminoglycoside phosphotransferase domain-containing protein n=1 Tax=Sporothrix stenoceras TaxID=5173 RepID=A0ABR3ZB78_9PEZI